MRLSHIQVTNLRGIESLSFNLFDYTSLVGPNNSCKSSALRAVEHLLTGSSPQIEEWHQGNITDPIVITGRFTNLQDWERKMPGIAGLVYADQIHLMYTAEVDTDAGKKISVRYSSERPDEHITGFSDKWGEISDEVRQVAEQLEIQGKDWRNKSNRERVKQEIRDSMPNLVQTGDLQWTDEGVSIPAALQQALPQPILIPAVRDASDESKPGAKTSFGILLQKVVLPAIIDSDEYSAFQAAIENLKTRLSRGDDPLPEVSAIGAAISDRLGALIRAEAILTMAPPDISKILGTGVSLRLDDGVETPVHLQGHGLQRALVYALLEVAAEKDQLAVAERAEHDIEPVLRRSSILLFEEPELFIHPQLLRRLRVLLKQISERPEWQVMLTTHSPLLVEVATEPRSLIIFRRSRQGDPPSLMQLDEDPFQGDSELSLERQRLRASLDFHPTVCEAFFGKNTVLVEGDSEQAILRAIPFLVNACGISETELAETVVVSCGGKWTIPPIARILTRFGIPFRVIHDSDQKGRSPVELDRCNAIDPFRANTRIASIVSPNETFVCEDCLEDLLWPDGDGPGGGKDKPFQAWKRVHHFAENPDETPRELRELVHFCFANTA